MIEVSNLRRVYPGPRRTRRRSATAPRVVVDDVTFSARAGQVTGFVGPNGAGKSSVMRLIAGLDHPTAGIAHVEGRPFAEHPAPMRALGVLIDAKAAHPGRTVRDHLRCLTALTGLARADVDHALELVGLTAAADRRVGALSLGMSQRLGLAGAVLGNPRTLLLDEPLNGLDPEGIHWMRQLMRDLAAQGRTVFVSSHLLTELALTADHLVVIAGGRVLTDEPMTVFMQRADAGGIVVRSPEPHDLRDLLSGLLRTTVGADSSLSSPSTAHDARDQPRSLTMLEEGAFEVRGLEAEAIGRAAARARVPLSELTSRRASLEETVMALTGPQAEG